MRSSAGAARVEAPTVAQISRTRSRTLTLFQQLNQQSFNSRETAHKLLICMWFRILSTELINTQKFILLKTKILSSPDVCVLEQTSTWC